MRSDGQQNVSQEKQRFQWKLDSSDNTNLNIILKLQPPRVIVDEDYNGTHFEQWFGAGMAAVQDSYHFFLWHGVNCSRRTDATQHLIPQPQQKVHQG
jgi:hypothetical protein